MSQLNSLLESANPYKSLQSDSARLASKWGKTGLLEGLGSETDKNNMSMILENQAKQLVTEDSNTGGGATAGTFSPGRGAQWAGVALPLVRKVFGQIAAKEFVSVQPMNLPSGLVFFLDFQYGTAKTPFAQGDSLYGDQDPANTFGNAAKGGLYGAGRFTYSTQDTESYAQAGMTAGNVDWFRDCNADGAVSASFLAGNLQLAQTLTTNLATDAAGAGIWDPTAVSAFYLKPALAADAGGAANAGLGLVGANQYAAFTKVTTDGLRIGLDLGIGGLGGAGSVTGGGTTVAGTDAGVTTWTTNGTGTGAVFTVTAAGVNLAAGVTITATNPGAGFKVGDAITFPAASLPIVGANGAYASLVYVIQGATEVGTFIQFVLNNGNFTTATGVRVSQVLAPTDANRGDFEWDNVNLNADNATATFDIPDINVQMSSEAIVAKTKKLKAVWTPEFAQDLNAYHSLDAEAELTSIMSEYISLEIDLEILGMLIEDAAAGTEYWSAENNLAISAGGVVNSDLGFYNSQGQWFQTLGTKMQKLSNIIHQRTLRGGANFLVCSPSVGTILESIPGFASNSDGDVSKASYAFGVQKAGTMNSRYTVYKNPYMTENTILMGYRGGQFLEAGAVFAPYIPLIMTPMIYDPNTFVPRKGLLTRYAKKMVRPEFYGKIMVSGLNTI
tara:strand:- start:7426 stop:9438 length:2013 start_codon:yes stop_codon:yes gene_type:complete